MLKRREHALVTEGGGGDRWRDPGGGELVAFAMAHGVCV